jgi:hypothetical protein
MPKTTVEIHVRCNNIVFPRNRWEAKGTVQDLPGSLIKVGDGYVHIANLIECAFVFI